jgi:porin
MTHQSICGRSLQLSTGAHYREVRMKGTATEQTKGSPWSRLETHFVEKTEPGPASSRSFVLVLFIFVSFSLAAAGQSGSCSPTSQSDQARHVRSYASLAQEPDDLRQELDADAAALSQIPADPIFRPDSLAFFVEPINTLTDRLARPERLKLGATYTFLNQYATIVPDGVRNNQASGRLDVTGAWVAYDHGSTAGSISMLVRSGTNIGESQQFNLSDKLGSGLFLNSLQGGGPQEPSTVNILYWRQDVFKKRLSFYVGKIHPNQYISLSMFNDNERTQFLNGGSDGDLAIPSDGTYAGGAAVELQATQHVYFHAVVVDTEGAQQRDITTLADRKYMEDGELGWFSGSPGKRYRDYRVDFWRDDTKTLGSGYGGGFGFEHELSDGWAPLGRVAFATATGTSIKQEEELGVAQVHPFGRSGDMFGVAFVSTEAIHPGKRHESVFESFYRLRVTQSLDLGPDVEVSIHPAYAIKRYTTTLLGLRMRVIF